MMKEIIITDADQFGALAEDYLAAKASADRKKELMERIRAAMTAYMTKQQMKVFENGLVSVKNETGTREQFDTKKFAADHPKTAKKYLKQVDVNRFTVKKV